MAGVVTASLQVIVKLSRKCVVLQNMRSVTEIFVDCTLSF